MIMDLPVSADPAAPKELCYVLPPPPPPPSFLPSPGNEFVPPAANLISTTVRVSELIIEELDHPLTPSSDSYDQDTPNVSPRKGSRRRVEASSERNSLTVLQSDISSFAVVPIGDFERKALQGLIKRLRPRPDMLDHLILALNGKCPQTPCVTFQRTRDGRMQIGRQKCIPQETFLRIFRFPDCTRDDLCSVKECTEGHEKSGNVCINPYHYDRYSDNGSSPPALSRRSRRGSLKRALEDDHDGFFSTPPAQIFREADSSSPPVENPSTAVKQQSEASTAAPPEPPAQLQERHEDHKNMTRDLHHEAMENMQRSHAVPEYPGHVQGMYDNYSALSLMQVHYSMMNYAYPWSAYFPDYNNAMVSSDFYGGFSFNPNNNNCYNLQNETTSSPSPRSPALPPQQVQPTFEAFWNGGTCPEAPSISRASPEDLLYDVLRM